MSATVWYQVSPRLIAGIFTSERVNAEEERGCGGHWTARGHTSRHCQVPSDTTHGLPGWWTLPLAPKPATTRNLEILYSLSVKDKIHKLFSLAFIRLCSKLGILLKPHSLNTGEWEKVMTPLSHEHICCS